MELYKPDIGTDISNDLLYHNVETEELFPIFQNTFLSFDPDLSFALNQRVDIYDSEIKLVLNEINKLRSIDQLYVKLQEIFLNTIPGLITENELMNFATALWNHYIKLK